jgi:excisionase family DNA binding protein
MSELAQEIISGVVAALEGRPRPRLLTVQGAADYLSRSPASIRQLIHRGVIPKVSIDGRVQIDIRDLDKVVEQSKERAI